MFYWVEESIVFDQAGKYEIQRERAYFSYTYTPKLLCGEDFIKSDDVEALESRNMAVQNDCVKILHF